jgi:SAM-dependent methyltransferase
MIIKPERKPCCCGGNEFKVLDRFTESYGFDKKKRQIVSCRSCGLVTRSPSLFDDAYIRNDLPVDLNIIGVYAGDAPQVESRLIKRLDRVSGLVKNRKLLDIGAGTGTFLRQAIGRGWSGVGVELDISNIELIRLGGMRCLDCDVCAGPVTNEQFDLIHANRVFEHLADPLAALRNLRTNLSSGGIIVIEVPNEFQRLASIVRRIAGKQISSKTGFLEHEWFYTITTLGQLLKKSGYSIVDLKTPRMTGSSIGRDLFYATEYLANRGAVIEAWARVA